uniref:Phosphoinositide phospholipase C n=2 Tax=Parascaris univalens TaxID=6257 RepID=A0A915BI20_PARUN
MTTPFGADDLIKRSILGSIIGFAHKKPKPPSDNGGETSCSQCGYRSSVKNPHESANLVTASYKNDAVQRQIYDKVKETHSITINEVDTHRLQYRSQQDIYREIVCECAQLESAASIYSSRSSSESFLSGASSEEFVKFDASRDNKVPFDECSTSGSCSSLSLTAFDSHSNCTRISIEDFVKLVVSAVKEGGLLLTHKGGHTETPEEILRRRRAQNNEAAARYRRRQRGLREEAEAELQLLVTKNKQLKEQVQSMQAEIARIKAAVLNSQSSTHP